MRETLTSPKPDNEIMEFLNKLDTTEINTPDNYGRIREDYWFLLNNSQIDEELKGFIETRMVKLVDDYPNLHQESMLIALKDYKEQKAHIEKEGASYPDLFSVKIAHVKVARIEAIFPEVKELYKVNQESE